VKKVVGTTATADEALMRTLYEQHAPALFGFVLRLVEGDRARAEDVVQEALLRAWRHPEALKAERGDVRPWLFTVARRLVIDGQRRRHSRPVEVDAPALEAVPAENDDFERLLETWEVADALRGLSPEHRAVLLETYYRGHSVAEAAEVLHVPRGTVKSRVFYALRALRLRLEERGMTR
jgi:RNA polymerase sigma-70 factor (ECF subfamily)